MEQSTRSSRRRFVKGLLGGAATLVLGFDPVHRSWVTSALADPRMIAIPELDGVLVTDAATLATYADDFGHLVHHAPVAALKPGSVEDVVKAVRFCRRHGIQVAARGQGHSTGGQTQVPGGLVVDMATLAAIEHVGSEHVRVQAGLRWKDLLATTVPLGLTPPVLTGFVGLSIGGTLSMGGIGAASFRAGAQVDNVLELEVVTGEGELIACSRDTHPLLFNAVLGGVGQYGIIVRARLPLEEVLPSARNYVIDYADAGTFFEDMDRLTSDGKVDGVYAQIVPDGNGGWVYAINANKFFAPDRPPNDSDVLRGLHIAPGALQTMDFDTLSFDTLVDAQIAFLQSILGYNDLPHVWSDIFLPASEVETFVQESLADLTAADFGPGGLALLFPVRNRLPEALAFRLPREKKVFLFDVLTSGSAADPSYAPTELAKSRARFVNARAVGGTLYPIGSTPMTKADWIVQYGSIYPFLLRAKDRYDPAHIMTPGAGIF